MLWSICSQVKVNSLLQLIVHALHSALFVNFTHSFIVVFITNSVNFIPESAVDFIYTTMVCYFMRDFKALPLDFHVTDGLQQYFQMHLSILGHPISVIEHLYSNSDDDFQLIIIYFSATGPSTPSFPISHFNHVYALVIRVHFPSSTRAFVNFITGAFVHVFMLYLFVFDLHQHLILILVLLIYFITLVYFIIHLVVISLFSELNLSF